MYTAHQWMLVALRQNPQAHSDGIVTTLSRICDQHGLVDLATRPFGVA